MKWLKELQKTIKAHHIIAVLGGLILVYIFMQYSNKKGSILDNMTTNKNIKEAQQELWHDSTNGAKAMPAEPLGQNETYATVSGMNNSQSNGLPPSQAGDVVDPKELLPKDQNSEWAKLNPVGNHNLQSVNFLQAGYHHGIDTVGSTLRNANLQVRSEPPNPRTKVSPWMNSTIEPDLMRVPLEIGRGPQ